jgi:hypothetical protein
VDGSTSKADNPGRCAGNALCLGDNHLDVAASLTDVGTFFSQNNMDLFIWREHWAFNNVKKTSEKLSHA